MYFSVCDNLLGRTGQPNISHDYELVYFTDTMPFPCTNSNGSKVQAYAAMARMMALRVLSDRIVDELRAGVAIFFFGMTLQGVKSWWILR